MYCLHCGDCCKRMSPLTAPEPCPNIVETKGFVLCSKYKGRPIECENHSFDNRFCPIGISVLKLNDIEDIQKRINDGWNLIREMEYNDWVTFG